MGLYRRSPESVPHCPSHTPATSYLCADLHPRVASCRQYCSLLLLLGVAVLFFGVLLTVSERFFCPAVELISEFLQLPPAVAGATLLAFGNGAPDIFTQVAAVGQVMQPAMQQPCVHSCCSSSCQDESTLPLLQQLTSISFGSQCNSHYNRYCLMGSHATGWICPFQWAFLPLMYVYVCMTQEQCVLFPV